MIQRTVSSPPALTAITVQTVGDGPIIVMTVCGTWDAPLDREAFAVLRECLALRPAGLIIDLTALHDANADSIPVWMNARRRGADMQPPVPVALCVSPLGNLGDRLQSRGAHRFLPVYAKVRQAHVALHGRTPLTDRLVLHLTPDAQAPALARQLVDDACQAWRQPHLQFPGRLVVSELVSNAVQHAGTDIKVIVSRRATALHLIVSDKDRRLPQLPTPVVPQRLTEGGRGLQVVQDVAALWGTTRTSDGKIVWATIHPLQDTRRTTAPR
jgi:anti-sigma regulatory factor (Ser/Thr protein kinase)